MDSDILFNLKICSLPSNELVYENALFLNPKDYETIKKQAKSKNCVHLMIKNHIMHVKSNDNVPQGSLAIGKLFRESMSISESLGTIETKCIYSLFSRI
jgi:hypothetical protein